MKQVDLGVPAVARYLTDIGTRETALLRRLRDETAGLPRSGMQVSPDQGQLLAFLAGLIGARQALEIGTFTGYSALAVAMALPPDGKLVTCDVDEAATAIARRYWAEAGIAERIDLRLGPAIETLEALLADGREDGFDFAFIDADKANYDAYFERCLRLVRPGGLIAVDNALWGGDVADPEDQDADTAAIDALNRKIRADSRVDMCLVPVGDGMMLARRLRFPRPCGRVRRAGAGPM